MINKDSFKDLKKKGYSEQVLNIFKLNKFKQKEVYLMEECLKERLRLENDLKSFKNTFKSPEFENTINILEQFFYSYVMGRNGLLEKGLKLKNILEENKERL